MLLTSKPFSPSCSESFLYCPDFRLHLSEGVLCSPVSSGVLSFLKPAAEELDAHLECPAQCPILESQARRASAVTGSQGSIVGFSVTPGDCHPSHKQSRTVSRVPKDPLRPHAQNNNPQSSLSRSLESAWPEFCGVGTAPLYLCFCEAET